MFDAWIFMAAKIFRIWQLRLSEEGDPYSPIILKRNFWLMSSMNASIKNVHDFSNKKKRSGVKISSVVTRMQHNLFVPMATIDVYRLIWSTAKHFGQPVPFKCVKGVRFTVSTLNKLSNKKVYSPLLWIKAKVPLVSTVVIMMSFRTANHLQN